MTELPTKCESQRNVKIWTMKPVNTFTYLATPYTDYMRCSQTQPATG